MKQIFLILCVSIKFCSLVPLEKRSTKVHDDEDISLQDILKNKDTRQFLEKIFKQIPPNHKAKELDRKQETLKKLRDADLLHGDCDDETPFGEKFHIFGNSHSSKIKHAFDSEEESSSKGKNRNGRFKFDSSLNGGNLNDQSEELNSEELLKRKIKDLKKFMQQKNGEDLHHSTTISSNKEKRYTSNDDDLESLKHLLQKANKKNKEDFSKENKENDDIENLKKSLQKTQDIWSKEKNRSDEEYKDDIEKLKHLLHKTRESNKENISTESHKNVEEYKNDLEKLKHLLHKTEESSNGHVSKENIKSSEETLIEIRKQEHKEKNKSSDEYSDEFENLNHLLHKTKESSSADISKETNKSSEDYRDDIEKLNHLIHKTNKNDGGDNSKENNKSLEEYKEDLDRLKHLLHKRKEDISTKDIKSEYKNDLEKLKQLLNETKDNDKEDDNKSIEEHTHKENRRNDLDSQEQSKNTNLASKEESKDLLTDFINKKEAHKKEDKDTVKSNEDPLRNLKDMLEKKELDDHKTKSEENNFRDHFQKFQELAHKKENNTSSDSKSGKESPKYNDQSEEDLQKLKKLLDKKTAQEPFRPLVKEVIENQLKTNKHLTENEVLKELLKKSNLNNKDIIKKFEEYTKKHKDFEFNDEESNEKDDKHEFRIKSLSRFLQDSSEENKNSDESSTQTQNSHKNKKNLNNDRIEHDLGEILSTLKHLENTTAKNKEEFKHSSKGGKKDVFEKEKHYKETSVDENLERKLHDLENVIKGSNWDSLEELYLLAQLAHEEMEYYKMLENTDKQ